jgi:hypothetical protein
VRTLNLPPEVLPSVGTFGRSGEVQTLASRPDWKLTRAPESVELASI